MWSVITLQKIWNAAPLHATVPPFNSKGAARGVCDGWSDRAGARADPPSRRHFSDGVGSWSSFPTLRKAEENTRKTYISRSPCPAWKSLAIEESYVQGRKLSVVRFFAIHFSSFCVKTCCGPPFLLQPSKSVGSLNKRQNSGCWSSAWTRTSWWTCLSYVA